MSQASRCRGNCDKPADSRPFPASKLDEWLEELSGMKVKRSQMNTLIMNYLVHEGFKEAAERFRLEAGLDMSPEEVHNETEMSMTRRIEIRNAIETGRILEAMKLLNDYFPELIDDHRNLYFKLQQQQLIELIREEKVEEALKFAQEQLSVDGDYLQLPELERTLALLAFDKPHESPYGDLLDYTQRQQLASQVNEAILEEQGGDSSETGHPPLVSLIKLLLWTQDELDKSKMKYAKLKDISDPSIAPPE